MVAQRSLSSKLLLVLAICCVTACHGKDGLRVSETAETALQRHQHKPRGQEKRPMASEPYHIELEKAVTDKSPHVEIQRASSQKPPILQMKKQPPGRIGSMSASWVEEVHQSSARTVSPKQLMRKENDSLKGKPKIHRSSGMQSSKSYPKKRRGFVNQSSGELPYYWKIPQPLGPPKPFDASTFYPTLTPTTICCTCAQAGSCEQQPTGNRGSVKCNLLSS